MYKLLLVSALSVIALSSSCKKEELVDLCTNGFLDPVEVEPDCGGSCKPCTSEPLNYVYSELNGKSTSFTTKTFGYNSNFNSWVLVLANDTLNITLGAGPNGNIGTYDWDANTSYSYENNLYPIKQNGVLTISSKDNNLASGYFSGTFIRPANNLLPSDTVRIESGQFLEVEY